MGPKTWDLCDRYVKKCTENRGVKRGRSVDCTIRTGCIARTEAGVVGPQGQACRKISKKHWSRGKKACCPQSQDCRSVPSDHWGRYDEKRRRKTCQEEPTSWQPGTGFDDRGPLGARTTKHEERGSKEESTNGWRASTEPLMWDLRGISTGKQ